MKHLEELILRLLLEQPMTGYGLAKEIEQKTGWKPSWGSIYPTLENLETDGIVKVKESGRSKLYSLTAIGKKDAEKRLSQSKELLMEIVERMRILQTLLGEDMTPQIQLLQRMAEGEKPFLPIEKSSMRLKKALASIILAGDLPKHQKKINTILMNATKELEQL